MDCKSPLTFEFLNRLIMIPFYQKTFSFKDNYCQPFPCGSGLLFVLMALLGFSHASLAQISLSNGTPVTQDFNGVGAGLPASWN